MIVSAYQGVRTVTMTNAGYSVPLRGVEFPGYAIGLRSCSGGWAQNPNSSINTSGIPCNWSDITNLDTGAVVGINPASVYNIWFYQFSPTGLKTVQYSGGPELTLGDDNTFNDAMYPIVFGNNLYMAFVVTTGPHLLFNLWDVTTGTTYTTAQASIIQSGAPPGAIHSFFQSFRGEDDFGNPLMILTQGTIAGVQTQTWAWDGTNAINSFVDPSSIHQGDRIIGYSGGSNRYIVLDTDTNFLVVDFTVANGSYDITYTNQDTLSFDQDATTQICLTSNNVFGFGHYFPELEAGLGGYIFMGVQLAGSSAWYLMSHDASQYWNLKFTAGPASPTNGMIVDSSGNIYTIDNTNGSVFISGSAPPAPTITPLAVQQTPPYPLSNCFQVKRLKGQC